MKSTGGSAARACVARNVRRGRLLRVVAAGALAMCAGAQAQETKDGAGGGAQGAARREIHAYRGTAGSIEVEHAAAALRAKAGEPNAPVLVRVRPASRAGFFTIEYLGLRTGEFDLATLIERVDGRPADLRPIPIRFESRLPPNAGTDVFGQRPEEIGLRVWYREALIALSAAWLLVPVIVMVRRRLARKPVEAVAMTPREPTTIERLRAILSEAGEREISVDERARMELLLLRAMREQAPAAGSARELAAALASLRRGEATGEVVRAVEAWTHAERGGAREQAVAAAVSVAGSGREVGPERGLGPERVAESAGGGA
ncbi:MAG: hypothetical protein U0638_06360 [Phycisphaerales bacterium]